MQRFETKYDLLKAAYNDSSLKKSTILLMQYLVHKSNKEQCFPAVKTIAKALSVCERTVQNNMRKLENAGYIIRKTRYYNHQQLSNQYIFNLGVIEDVTKTERYLESEKEKINQEAIEDEECKDINKAEEVLKVYNMPLSSREKLILIYLLHRASQKGFVYGTSREFMNAIGVSNRVLSKILSKLRSKNLIRIRTINVSGKKLFLIKLTGIVWEKERVSNSYNTAITKRQVLLKRELHYINSQQDKRCKNVLHIIKDTIQTRRKAKRCKKHYYANIWKKCKGTIQSGLDKIRTILRL